MIKRNIYFTEMYKKAYPDLQKEKQCGNEQKLWLRQDKRRKDQEQYKKTMTELKGRAGKFHKSRTTILVKTV